MVNQYSLTHKTWVNLEAVNPQISFIVQRPLLIPIPIIHQRERAQAINIKEELVVLLYHNDVLNNAWKRSDLRRKGKESESHLWFVFLCVA